MLLMAELRAPCSKTPSYAVFRAFGVTPYKDSSIPFYLLTSFYI